MNTDKELLEFIKKYLAYKTQNLYDNAKKVLLAKTDLQKVVDDILESSSIDEVKEYCHIAKKDGLSTLGNFTYGTASFHDYIVKKEIADLHYINDELLIDYKDTIKAPTTKVNYLKAVTELLQYIENDSDYKFNITYKNIVPNSKGKKARDALDRDEFIKFNKSLTTMEYKDDKCFERFRDILLVRFVLLAGLRPDEIISLKLDESLIYDSKDFYIDLGDKRKELKSKKEFIRPPRKQFVRLLNSYIKHKDRKENKDGYFFYGIADKDKKIDTQHIKKLIVKFLDHAGIKKRDTDSEMLRGSLAVYLYNERSDKGQIRLKVIAGLLGVKESVLENMIGFHKVDYVSISDSFDELLSNS